MSRPLPPVLHALTLLLHPLALPLKARARLVVTLLLKRSAALLHALALIVESLAAVRTTLPAILHALPVIL